jgi:curved DNA-binding protein CbpA
MKDYYACLGVSPLSNKNAIRQNYLRIARVYHPDKKPEALV